MANDDDDSFDEFARTTIMKNPLLAPTKAPREEVRKAKTVVRSAPGDPLAGGGRPRERKADSASPRGHVPVNLDGAPPSPPSLRRPPEVLESSPTQWASPAGRGRPEPRHPAPTDEPLSSTIGDLRQPSRTLLRKPRSLAVFVAGALVFAGVAAGLLVAAMSPSKQEPPPGPTAAAKAPSPPPRINAAAATEPPAPAPAMAVPLPPPAVAPEAPAPTAVAPAVAAEEPKPKAETPKRNKPKPEDDAPPPVRTRKAFLLVKASPGVTILIDDHESGRRTPLSEPIALEAGARFVTLVAPDGRRKVFAVELEAGDTFQLAEDF